VSEKTAACPAAAARERTVGQGAAAEFERLYRANVEAVMAYFARRSRDPQVVAGTVTLAVTKLSGISTP
jgi:hypothetical protein